MCLLNEYVEYNKHPVSRYLMGYVFYDKNGMITWKSRKHTWNFLTIDSSVRVLITAVNTACFRRWPVRSCGVTSEPTQEKSLLHANIAEGRFQTMGTWSNMKKLSTRVICLTSVTYVHTVPLEGLCRFCPYNKIITFKMKGLAYRVHICRTPKSWLT